MSYREPAPESASDRDRPLSLWDHVAEIPPLAWAAGLVVGLVLLLVHVAATTVDARQAEYRRSCERLCAARTASVLQCSGEWQCVCLTPTGTTEVFDQAFRLQSDR